MYVKIIGRVQVIQIASVYSVEQTVHFNPTAGYTKQALLIEGILLAHALNQLLDDWRYLSDAARPRTQLHILFQAAAKHRLLVIGFDRVVHVGYEQVQLFERRPVILSLRIQIVHIVVTQLALLGYSFVQRFGVFVVFFVGHRVGLVELLLAAHQLLLETSKVVKLLVAHVDGRAHAVRLRGGALRVIAVFS